MSIQKFDSCLNLLELKHQYSEKSQIGTHLDNIKKEILSEISKQVDNVSPVSGFVSPLAKQQCENTLCQCILQDLGLYQHFLTNMQENSGEISDPVCNGIQKIKQLIFKHRLPEPSGQTSVSLNHSPVKEEDSSDESDIVRKPDISNIESDSDIAADDANTGQIPESSKIFIGGLNNKKKNVHTNETVINEDLEIDEILDVVENISKHFQTEQKIINYCAILAPNLYISFLETLLQVYKILENQDDLEHEDEVLSYLQLKKAQILFILLKMEICQKNTHTEKAVEIAIRFAITKAYLLAEKNQLQIQKYCDNEQFKTDIDNDQLEEIIKNYKKAIEYSNKEIFAQLSQKPYRFKTNVLLLTILNDSLLDQKITKHFAERNAKLENSQPQKHGTDIFQNDKILFTDTQEYMEKSEIEDFCKIFSVWELYSKKLDKKQLQAHFIATQNQRPEFLFHLILKYLNEEKYQKVNQLIDQFQLQEFSTQIYRQYKTSSILMIKMKYYCNVTQKYANAIECADYLIEIAKLDQNATIMVRNPQVVAILAQDIERRAYFLLQAGIAYSIYSDSCEFYSKRKMMKKRALAILDMSLQIQDSNPITWLYFSLTLLELGNLPAAKKAMRECMTHPQTNGEQNELCVALWCLLMLHDGNSRNALKLLKYSIKNFIGFTPLTQLVKARIEINLKEEKVEYEPTITGMSYHITKQRAESLNGMDDHPFVGGKNKKKKVNNEEIEMVHMRHQDISASSILIQMRDIDSINIHDEDPQFVQTIKKAISQMIITSSQFAQTTPEKQKLAVLLPNGKYVKKDYVTLYISFVKQACLMQSQLYTDKVHLTELKKWFNQQLFKQLDTRFLNALIDQKLEKNKAAKKIFKELSRENMQAAQIYCEYLFAKLPSKIDKVYSILNYCLKKDYRNPKTWSLLGQLYDFMASQRDIPEAEEPKKEPIFKSYQINSNFEFETEKKECIIPQKLKDKSQSEKAAFCYMKAIKYESRQIGDLASILQLIQKQIC